MQFNVGIEWCGQIQAQSQAYAEDGYDDDDEDADQSKESDVNGHE